MLRYKVAGVGQMSFVTDSSSASTVLSPSHLCVAFILQVLHQVGLRGRENPPSAAVSGESVAWSPQNPHDHRRVLLASGQVFIPELIHLAKKMGMIYITGENHCLQGESPSWGRKKDQSPHKTQAPGEGQTEAFWGNNRCIHQTSKTQSSRKRSS